MVSAIPIRRAAVALLLTGLALVLCASAGAAQLVGGAEQAAVERAFFAHRAHRGQIVVSVRRSSLDGDWTVVRSVLPDPAGSTRRGDAVPRLRTSYLGLASGAWRPGRPPAPVLADLRQRFTLEVDYRGSGAEHIGYQEQTPGVCAGLGGFTDSETDVVSPMRWSVRYEVDPDALLSAVRGPTGPILVVRVRVIRTGSFVTATERQSRTILDLSCARHPFRYDCTRTWRLARSSDLFAVERGSGLTIGVPTSQQAIGDCADIDYPLGPSLWASGASTARVRELKLVGGPLPADPYEPVDVSWPANSAPALDGLVTSPCQGLAATCTDRFRWHGVVTLVAADGG